MSRLRLRSANGYDSTSARSVEARIRPVDPSASVSSRLRGVDDVALTRLTSALARSAGRPRAPPA
jgi:hypothetical protein